MSLITCCPACGTMFKVVPDQLKISEGWVRCGHCANIFDATAHLLEQLPEALAAQGGHADPGQPSAGGGDAGPGATVTTGGHAGPGQLAPQGAHPGQDAARMPQAGPGTDASRTAAIGIGARAFEPHRETFPSSGFADDAADADPSLVLRRRDEAPLAVGGARLEPEPATYEDAVGDAAASAAGRLATDEAQAGATHAPLEPAAAATPTAGSSTDGEDDHAPLADVSFVRQARRRAFWRRPLVRAGLVLLALGLVVLLAGQFVVHERDRIAAMRPDLRPLLLQLCEPLRCTLGPPRQIEAVAIEGSTFTKLRPDTYRLSFTLRNAAAMPIAVPSFELTLTDTQDQAVLRRVLSPAEIGSPSAVLAAGGDWSGALVLAVANGSAARVAGYRLLAFYP